MTVSSKVSSLRGYAAASLWHNGPEAWHEAAPGLKRRILCHSLTGMMVLYGIAPGTVFPLHNHPHAQFGVFLEGSGTFKVGEETWTMKEGDSYYVPPGIHHELRINPNKETVLVDFFTPDREDYAKEALQPDKH
jgi:quercetin dioxygenase-like cupin family protein